MIGSLRKPCFCKFISLSNAAKIMPKVVAESHGKHSLAGTDVAVAFFDSIDKATDWEITAPAYDLFLQKDYLKTLELAVPEGMQFVYLVFYKKRIPIGIAYGQVLDFNSTKNVPIAPHHYFKKWLLRQLNFKFLFCGNLLSTGEHAFHFKKEISTQEVTTLLSKALQLFTTQSRLHNRRIAATIIKDLPENVDAELFKNQGFVPIHFQPSMIFDLNPNWQSFEDYLHAMSSKYRVRARRALKKATDLKWREWNAAEIEKNLSKVNELYKNIAQGADFNAVHLRPQHFLNFKIQLPQQFRFFAVFEKENLIGFYTTLQNEDELEAHYLGYDLEANHHNQLYLNMLYRMIQQGIEMNVKRIVFARTAMEIKSSVGAVAQELVLYMRPTAAWSSPIWRTLIHFFEPKITWTPRHPFRE